MKKNIMDGPDDDGIDLGTGAQLAAKSKSDTPSFLADGVKSDNLSDLIVAPMFGGKIALDLTASVESRWQAARENEEHGKARFAALGLLLLSIKKDVPHGEFIPELERRGFEERAAQRAMSYARYVFSQPAQRQERLLEMPVSKVAELAKADPEVVEVLMEDGQTVERTTVRELVSALKAKDAAINRLQSDLNTAQSRLAAKGLPPPLLSREADKHVQAALNAEAIGAAALDLLNRQIGEMADGGDYLTERLATLHSCLCALASRVSMTFDALQTVANDCEVKLPSRPQMVVNEDMARGYLAAYTGYIETAIELAQKQLIARSEVLGRGPGRPVGSKGKRKGGA